MSDESHPSDKSGRDLRAEEKLLVDALLKGHPCRAELLPQLETMRVMDLSDGGMGSVRFLASNAVPARSLGPAAAEAEWRDIDGVPVSAVLNLDRDGNLYELDIWKVDFSPLKKYPESSQIRVSRLVDDT